MHRLLAFISLLLTQIAFGQNVTISGFIDDELTGERLPGVNIYVTGKPMGMASNTYGFYSLTIPKGEYQINVSIMGFGTQKVQLSLQKDTVINWHLSAVTEMLEEAVVTADPSQPESTQMSQIEVPVLQIKKLPAFMGEVDVLKVIQLLPGVQSGNEGTSGIYVRGGSS